MKLESVDSLMLELSMNSQCRFMKLGDLTRFQEEIDQKDDERREKSFRVDKWFEETSKSFEKQLWIAIEVENWEVVREVYEKWKRLNVDYISTRKKLRKEELHYEKLDDEERREKQLYTTLCIEKTKYESHKINLNWLSKK